MIINKAKTKELIFRRPHPTKFDMPDPLDCIAQERAAKLLGVIFTGKLCFDDHVDCVDCLLSGCLLKLLREVRAFQYSSYTWSVCLILSRVTYALPAWGGQLTRQLQERLDAFLKRARKFGFCD